MLIRPKRATGSDSPRLVQVRLKINVHMISEPPVKAGEKKAPLAMIRLT
jgi:hypothetical protein